MACTRGGSGWGEARNLALRMSCTAREVEVAVVNEELGGNGALSRMRGESEG
jgi:hypothetical protein